MGPKPLGNISKMPMKKCSFSSHPIKTVFGKSFILPLEKKKKKKSWGGGEILVLYGGNCDDRRAGNREEKVRASKARGTRRD